MTTHTAPVVTRIMREISSDRGRDGERFRPQKLED